MFAFALNEREAIKGLQNMGIFCHFLGYSFIGYRRTRAKSRRSLEWHTIIQGGDVPGLGSSIDGEKWSDTEDFLM